MDGPDKYAKIKEIISTIFEDHKYRYGYRRITLELHNQGHCINHKTVQRLMRELGLFCLVRMKKYKSYKGTIGKISPNRLERNFKAEKPNQKWVTDVTEFALLGQKLYLSPILDLYNGEIVAYNISEHPNFAQTMDMLNKAFSKRPNLKGLIFHSDQGWQYQMKKYQCRLKGKGILQSMSRKGNCLDNAVIENFFGHLKSELLYLKEFSSIEQFKFELIDYLDYYNNRRIKSKLGGRSPVQYRLLAA
jgi:transposase InsO family protein